MMSFGGKSFKKNQIKKELELLAKISHDEFSSLPPGEKAAIREQSYKNQSYKRTKGKKIKPRDIGMLDDRSYVFPSSPSIDLGPEMRESVDLQGEPEVPITNTRVASIKSNVDLNVVMQGKGIKEKSEELSGIVAVNTSKHSQRASAGRCKSSLRTLSANKETSSPTPENITLPKPAILSSQNSALPVHLTERPAPKPVSVTRPASKISTGRRSVKSRASHTQTPSGLSEHPCQEETDNTNLLMEETEKEEDILFSEEGEEKEQDTNKNIIEEIHYEEDEEEYGNEEEEEEELSSEQDDRPDILEEQDHENPSDKIHSSIQALTQSLMGRSSDIMSMLQASTEMIDSKSSAVDIDKQHFKDSTSNLKFLNSSTADLSFSVMGNNKSVSQTFQHSPGAEQQPTDEGSTQKNLQTETKTQLSPVKIAPESRPGIGTSSTREWPGLLTLDSQPTSLTDEEAKEILECATKVESEDILNVQGSLANLSEKEQVIPVNSVNNTSSMLKTRPRRVKDVTFLGSWPEKKVTPDHNIHHFCKMATTMEISPQLHQITRDSHTPDHLHGSRRLNANTWRSEAHYIYRQQKHMYLHEDKSKVMSLLEQDQLEKEMDAVAQRILQNAFSENTEEMMYKLKRASDSLFDENEDDGLRIDGVQFELKDDSSRLYWTPAPPKMGLAPETIRNFLYPEYQGSAMLQESLGPDNVALTAIMESENEEEEDDDSLKLDAQQLRNRVVKRRYSSVNDLTQQLFKEESAVKLAVGDTDNIVDEDDYNVMETKDESAINIEESARRFQSMLDKRHHQLKEEKQINEELGYQVDEEETSERYRRAYSEPMLTFEKEQIQLPSDYDVSMKELEYQVDAVAAMKQQLQDASQQEEKEQEDDDYQTEQQAVTMDLHSHAVEESESHPYGDVQSTGYEGESEDLKTETETMSVTTVTSRATGLYSRKLHNMPRMKHQKKHRRRKTIRQQTMRGKRINQFLAQPVTPLSRSKSFHCIQSVKKENEKTVSISDDLERAKSLDDLQGFEDRFLVNQTDNEPIDNMFDWIREQYWYKWFDEVYPPSTTSPELRYDLMSVTTPIIPSESKASGTVIDSAILDTIQVIQPEISETDNELYEALQQETEKLSSLIEQTEKNEMLAFYLCRRGAIYRKIGQLKKAWDDLNRAIELENMLLDAYWHRHLLHLIQNNRKAALDDLTFIIKYNSNQARAYRSRAELYRQDGDATMAIVNYSQAIKLNPNDVETYYQRADMFKMRGDVLLALEDYKIAAQLLPSRTEAMFEIGKFHFNNENWSGAVNDFKEILQQDPQDSVAYTYRGRVYAQMGQFNNAIRDFSAAIHYDPNNALALYHRGCILRKVHPRRALQDLSVSLLLDSSENNVNAFLHRGILYTDMKRWEDAIPDFEAALELNPELPSAHVNIGLIYIIKYNNYQKAVRRYTGAIHVDPTYIRARICRAEAYQKMGMLQEAILDYTRVIHMRPDVPDYHMARGKVLLEQNKMDLASYHVRQAAKLNQGLGASATQQAVVQSFLKNFDQAIEVLERATRVKPTAQLFVLLGKTNMKAKRFANAIESFQKAIQIMTPWNTRSPLPLEAAPVFFLIGMCHVELSDSSSALDAFNDAIRVNPEYAEAFYQRGLTKMKLSHSKGIHDFNRALAINPTLFQAFLSRAAYYGMRNRYSKGIMSCNEAIKLQPGSVRAYLYRGALKYHIKAYSLAVKDLTEAVAIDCRCSLAYFNRAVCYHEMRYFQKALMDYSTVILLEDKPNIKVLQNRGLLYLEINDVENSLEDFKAAAKVSENDPKIRHALGLCYHRLNRLEESVAAFNDALRIDPFFVEAYNGRGNALMDFGHEQGNIFGRRDYLKALHIDPQCLSARVNLAYNLQVEGKYRDSWNQFTAAITMDASCQAALEGRAVVNLQMKNTFGALLDMNAAIKISKTAELLNNRGVVHQFMDDYVNAIHDYQSAIKQDPSYALAYYNAGNVYFKQRQFKQASSYYSKALSWTPDDESAVLNRAITRVLLRDAKGAIQDFHKAVDLNPYAAHVYFNRGNLYSSLRKYKEAEEDYTRALSLRPGDALVYKKRADVLGKMSKKNEAIEDYKKAIIIKTRAATVRKG
ncbi:uncharacterized protein LOC116304042 [Actinia tenebrosa]|uniref:Uncharacterized protein LOC116304042 n=1 Tax=Actinia tenebrosa TaxID=6105 RepID=A0A6P8IRP7_ACTTE|nr:uncharacterized protein LOC116304042 [Actinia tenebrosa]